MVVLAIFGYLLVAIVLGLCDLVSDDTPRRPPKRLTRADRRAQDLTWKDAIKRISKEHRKKGHWF
jgi:hypothetical protein